MDEKVSSYFKNGRRKIVAVTPVNDYKLLLKFDNKEVKVYDATPILFGLLELLKDKNKFDEVFLDKNGTVAWDIDATVDSNIFWNNRITFCPDRLYLDSIIENGDGNLDE